MIERLLPRVNTPSKVSLIEDEQGVALIAGSMRLQADFTHMIKRLRPATLSKELLVRAAKPSKHHDEVLHAVDATAGLGEDALLLAAAGYHVTLIERDPLIAELLRDGLKRALDIHELATCASRMELIEGNSIELLPSCAYEADLIYLDPMFPAKKKNAQTKKKLQILQMLAHPCEDEEELFDAAVAAHAQKIVVKRPIRVEPLAGQQPSYDIKGKLIRYDCYVNTETLKPNTVHVA